MNEGFLEQGRTQLVSEAQRRAITGIADIRRREQTLRSELDVFGKAADDTTKPLKGRYQSQSQRIAEIIGGSEQPDEKSREERGIDQDSAPNLAALHFAKTASLQQEAGLPYDETLSRAKKQLEKAQERGIPRNTPADFLPDAYILRIAKKATEGVPLPSPQTVAQYMQGDTSLLEDYALVLPEDQRDEFIAAFPEDKRHEISVRLDKSVSTVLSGKLIMESEHIQQRDAVKERVREAFAHSLATLMPTPDGEKDFGGRRVGSRWSSKQLTETLVNLDEKDSAQLLRDLASQTTRELKAANKAKHLKKKSPEEKQEALQPFLSFTGRVLNTLVEADAQRGGTLTMRYLETSALPDRFFTFFSHKLVKEGYFNESLTPFLHDSENIPVLKKLMASYGKQFNTITDTLAQIPDYSKDHQLDPRKEELFDALKDLGTLTPRIFDRYRQKSPEERSAFAAKIRELKPKFFQNIPIKDILDPQDRDILTEMVYMAYKPNNRMTFGQVEGLIREVDDHTDDLDRYTFPQEGYVLNLEKGGGFVLKEGQKTDLGMLRRYKRLFEGGLPTKEDETQASTPFTDALRAYLQPESEDAEQGQRDPDEILRTLLAPLGKQLQSEITADKAYNVAGGLSEIAGVYFNDNYATQLSGYFYGPQRDDAKAFWEMMQDESVQQTIAKRLERFNVPFNPSIEAIAKLIQHEQMEPMRIQLESEMSKYTAARPSSDSAQDRRGGVKAYVSKNVGSFFAKAAADICTSDDVPLFERPDHFHINVVEDDETVRANNQAYVATVNGNPSLILRGFNPTAEWLGKIDAASYSEEILRVGRQFAQDNELAQVYITDQDGSWHALSNREQVARYLTNRYTQGKSGITHPLKVSSTHEVNKIYAV